MPARIVSHKINSNFTEKKTEFYQFIFKAINLYFKNIMQKIVYIYIYIYIIPYLLPTDLPSFKRGRVKFNN